MLPTHTPYSPCFYFEKINTGMFDGPQVRTLVCGQEFTRKMNEKESTAWFLFEKVIDKFFGLKRPI